MRINRCQFYVFEDLHLLVLKVFHETQPKVRILKPAIVDQQQERDVEADRNKCCFCTMSVRLTIVQIYLFFCLCDGSLNIGLGDYFRIVLFDDWMFLNKYEQQQKDSYQVFLQGKFVVFHSWL